ncbi:HK97 family phage prohead protease [Rhizobium sp. 2YAF20]|uniref:HK97 family phage prohead protease n=1 Tax=Rhizobium sp. 2YAF20 TaxID=3233027 RepID=UPI003F99008F
MTERETRSVPLEAPKTGRTLTGYAALFGSPTNIGGMFIEQIAYGAFTRALSGDVHAVLNHDFGRVIGRTTSGTLRLKQNAKGLLVEIDLPDAPDGQTALELVKRRDLTGMSFSFVPVVEEWDDSGDLPVRTLREVELFEVSIVARPAYADTSIALRTLERHQAKGIGAVGATRARMRLELKLRERGLIGKR